MARRSNLPADGLNDLHKDVCSETIPCLLSLANKGKPKDISELKRRISDYFQFCVDHDFRCGIESISLSLGVTRVTFWNWCAGNGCSREWQEVCTNAKQIIITFLESITLSGRLSPPIAIFALKNWADYKDVRSFDDLTPQDAKRPVITTKDIKLLLLESESKSDNTEDLPPIEFDDLEPGGF